MEIERKTSEGDVEYGLLVELEEGLGRADGSRAAKQGRKCEEPLHWRGPRMERSEGRQGGSGPSAVLGFEDESRKRGMQDGWGAIRRSEEHPPGFHYTRLDRRLGGYGRE